MSCEIIEETIRKFFFNNKLREVRGEFQIRYSSPLKSFPVIMKIIVATKKLDGSWREPEVSFENAVITESMLDELFDIIKDCVVRVKMEREATSE